MHSKRKLFVVSLFVLGLLILGAGVLSACSAKAPKAAQPTVSVSAAPNAQGVTEEAKACIDCHAKETPGIVSDWDHSAHAQKGVTCLDCHETTPDSPMLLKDIKGHEDVKESLSMLVPPSTCAKCHPDEVKEFDASGHHRAALQVEDKESMQTLIHHHEGRDIEGLSGASEETGCMQCHGKRIKLDEHGVPTADTYPTSGIGNIYPNGEVGNCTVCHTRHKFSIEEARKPEACASCHLGPDHPDIEIYENTKHGQIYATEGETWKWDSPPGDWEPGDYRAPTCATCHMSGIGDLKPTHNVSERLYWNAWAKESQPRNSDDPMSALTGHAEQGRAEMKQVCAQCHTSAMIDDYFASADKAVKLYNEGYYAPAKKMLDDLQAKGLLKDNPWADEFQILYYHLWHHEGRRARQGALMGGPDWAHWHGFFILQQDLYKMQDIYNYRIETGEIEKP
ncbi:MAG TPA: beta-ketoacyl-ACP synthase [Chloroflexi bacterium]|nr:beta-ketoacyl-ACP synthase [Chloroflexota bacterium]